MTTEIFAGLIWAFNLFIALCMAQAIGKSWIPAKHVGGWRRFMAWTGYLLSSLGLTWCIDIILLILLFQSGAMLFWNWGYLLLMINLLFLLFAFGLGKWAKGYHDTLLADPKDPGHPAYLYLHSHLQEITTYGLLGISLARFFGGGLTKNKTTRQIIGFFFVLCTLTFFISLGFILTALIVHHAAGGGSKAPSPPPEENGKQVAV